MHKYYEQTASDLPMKVRLLHHYVQGVFFRLNLLGEHLCPLQVTSISL